MGRYRFRLFGTKEDEEDDEQEQLEAHALIYDETGIPPPTRSRQCRRVVGQLIESSPCQFDNSNGYVDEYISMNGRQHEPADHSGPVPPKKKSWVWMFAVTAFVAFVAQWYGPPAPPPNSRGFDQSWSEFMFIEGSSIGSSLWRIFCAACYGMSWCVAGIHDDIKGIPILVRQYYHDWQEHRRFVCPLILPSPGLTESFLSTKIVGQPRAVSVVATAIDGWDTNDSNNEQRKPPLAMVLIGTAGVGKLEMSRQVSHLMSQHCSRNGNNALAGDVTSYYEGFLLLRGEDFADVVSYGSTRQPSDHLDISLKEEELTRRIGSHVQRQKGAGAVVVIHHVEKMPPAMLRRLCRQISAPEALLPYSKEARIEGIPPLPDDQVAVSLNNVVFIFTTNVGTKTIMQSLRKFGSMDNVPQLDLKLALRHELDLYFGDGNGELGHTFHAVAPFVRLEPSALEDILQQRIENISLQRAGQWKRLLITEAARKAVVDEEHVEYMDLRKKDSEISFIRFSAEGAKVLATGSPIMNRIKSQVRRCLDVNRPKHFAVLDYPGETRLALLCWCDTDNTSCDDPSCHEACRFSL